MTDSRVDGFMREALRLAAENARSGRGGPFAALVVKDGEVLGRGCNEVTPLNDPTAHAEVLAIREACRRLGTFRLDGGRLPFPRFRGRLYQGVFGEQFNEFELHGFNEFDHLFQISNLEFRTLPLCLKDCTPSRIQIFARS